MFQVQAQLMLVVDLGVTHMMLVLQVGRKESGGHSTSTKIQRRGWYGVVRPVGIQKYQSAQNQPPSRVSHETVTVRLKKDRRPWEAEVSAVRSLLGEATGSGKAGLIWTTTSKPWIQVFQVLGIPNSATICSDAGYRVNVCPSGLPSALMQFFFITFLFLPVGMGMFSLNHNILQICNLYLIFKNRGHS